jgi:hypothetical protein
MPTCSSFQPVTCGICICNPNLLTVGCAAAIAPNTSLCSPGVGQASCGMSQVTVAAGNTNIWPWVIGIGAALYLLSKHHKG